MHADKTIELDGRAVTLKELTVADIRAWLKSLENTEADFDLIGSALIDGASMADLTIMTDISHTEIEALTPSEIRRVFDACKEVNSDFFALRGRLEAIGRSALAMQGATSSAPPAP
jgi:hypothetical protein